MWEFQPGADIATPPKPAEWAAVEVPFLWTATWKYKVNRVGKSWSKLKLRELDDGWFETRVAIPQAWTGKVVYLELSGLQCDAVVWVNGKRLGELRGPDGRVAVTAAVTPGKEARIRLWVTRWWHGTKNQRANDPLRDTAIKGQVKTKWYKKEDDVRRGTPGGLAGRAALRAVPERVEIENVRVETSVRQGDIHVHVDYRLRDKSLRPRFEAQVAELDGSTTGLPSASGIVEMDGRHDGTRSHTLVARWPHPRLWEVGDPHLYRLRVRMVGPDGPVDEYHAVRFGFREVWAEGKELILNGHPLRLRLPYFVSSVPQMILFEGMGFNAMEFQPNPTAWYGTWGLFPRESATQAGGKLLDAADERGWAVLMPAPGVTHAKNAILKPAAQALYLRDLRAWLRRLDRQNRPSILSWVPSMNTGDNYNPKNLGRKPTTPRAEWYGKVEELIKSIDPSRLVFHHQGGRTGDMEMLNFYLNFAPLQEREEFLSAWSESGEKPWGVVEHGPPATVNFFKRSTVAYFTEYAAIYLGDEAYALEKDEYVQACLNVRPGGHHKSAFAGVSGLAESGQLAHVGEWTGYYRFMDLFIRNTNKAWRAWGVNGGWFPWIFNVGFGVPPGHKPTRRGWHMYSGFETPDEALKQRPEWANPIYDAYRDTMQSLLVFIGGPAKHFTAKDHSFYAGEAFEKTIVVVWDGPGGKQLSVDWELAAAGQVCAKGQATFSLGPGAIEKRPLHMTAPQVVTRTQATLKIVAKDDAGRPVSKDRLQLAVFPPIPRTPRAKSRWRIFDPLGKTTDELKRLGFSAEPLAPNGSLRGIDVLAVGYKALTQAKRMPFTLDDVDRGLRVVLFEQDVASLEAMGFRVQDVVPRHVFPRVATHPILRCIEPSDLVNWRGEGQLLPTTSEGMKVWPWPHAPHWGNAMSVASVVIETPHRGAFTPILECEFDLAYSPLLLWEHGEGQIVFCQLDLTSRVGKEPAASILASNLIDYLDSEHGRSQGKRVVCLTADRETASFVEGLGFESEATGTTSEASGLRPASHLVVVGPDGLANAASPGSAVREFVRRGGSALVMPQGEAQLQGAGLPWRLETEAAKLARVSPDALRGGEPLLRGVGPQLLHWRTSLGMDRFARAGLPAKSARLLGGLLLRVSEGKGTWLFSQLDWRPLNDGSHHLRRARWNMRKFHRQLLGNLGARTGRQVAEQFLSPRQFAPMVNVPLWQVLNKIAEVPADKGERNDFPGLQSLLPAERWVAKTSSASKRDFEWRLRAADKNGYLDLARLAPAREGRVGYAVTHVYASTARRASFALSSDYWCVFRVNGETVIDHGKTGRPRRAPRPGEIRLQVPFKKGWNRLEVKVASGNGGFGLWCHISDPGDLRVAPRLTAPESVPATVPAPGDLLKEPMVSGVDLLYCEPLQKEDDPYGFTRW